MKRLLLVLILASEFAIGQDVQNYQENINHDFMEYNDLIINREFDKAMDFMVQEFFEIVPKSTMVMMMNQVFNNPEIVFELEPPKDLNYGEPRLIEEKYYASISYSYIMKLKFINQEESEDEEENILNKSLTIASLEQNFGSGNVNYNEETGFYEVLSLKNAFGISEDGISDWRFVVVEPKQKIILEKILPKELTEGL